MGTKFFVLFLAILLHDALGNLDEISYNPRFRNVNKKFLKAAPIEIEEGKTMKETYLIDTQSQNIPMGGFVIVSTPLDTPSRKQHFADSLKMFQQFSAPAQSDSYKPNEMFDISLKDLNKPNNLPIVLQLLGYTGNPPQALAMPPKPTKMSPVMVDSKPEDVMMLNKPESDASLAVDKKSKPTEKPVDIVAPSSAVEDITAMKQEITTSNKPPQALAMPPKPTKMSPVMVNSKPEDVMMLNKPESDASLAVDKKSKPTEKPVDIVAPSSAVEDITAMKQEITASNKPVDLEVMQIEESSQKPIEILAPAVEDINEEISTSSTPIIEEVIQNEQTDTKNLSSVQDNKETVVVPVMSEIISETVPVMDKPSEPLPEKTQDEDKKEKLLTNSPLIENVETKPSMEKILEESSTMSDMTVANLPVIQKPMTNIVVEVIEEQLMPKIDEKNELKITEKVQKLDEVVKVDPIVMEKVSESLPANSDSSTDSKKQLDLNKNTKESLEAKLKEVLMNTMSFIKNSEKQQMAASSENTDGNLFSSEQKPIEDQKKTTVAVIIEKEDFSSDNTASKGQTKIPSEAKLNEKTYVETLLKKAAVLDLNWKPVQKPKEGEEQKIEVLSPEQQIIQDLMIALYPVEKIEKAFFQAMQMEDLLEMPSQDSSMLNRKKKPKPGRKPKPNKKPTKKPNLTLTQINTTTKKPAQSSSPAPIPETSDSKKPVESSSASIPETNDSKKLVESSSAAIPETSDL